MKFKIYTNKGESREVEAASIAAAINESCFEPFFLGINIIGACRVQTDEEKQSADDFFLSQFENGPKPATHTTMNYTELHRFLTEELHLEFKPITDGDWDAFGGAEEFVTGHRPLFLERDELVIVVDGKGLQVMGLELNAGQIGHDRYRIERLFAMLAHKGYNDQGLAFLKPEFDYLPL